jgi:NAD+ kinase
MSPVEAVRREVLLVTHGGREEARALARKVVHALTAAGITVRAHAAEVAELAPMNGITVADDDAAAAGCELVVVLGGDGTILRGVEIARPHDVPLLGVNLGHVGFLAEVEVDEMYAVVDAIVYRKWAVEERMALNVTARNGSTVIASTWALNEVSVEKAARERMLEVLVEVDERPLSRWGCDGVVVATPTGSTAYAFSAGGPVVWPDVEAMLVVPISAHALFSRAMVVGPSSLVSVELLATTAGGVLWCDGRRAAPLPPGSRVEVRRDAQPVRFARLHAGTFTDRLVAKFDLPVQGWRGAAARRRQEQLSGLQ